MNNNACPRCSQDLCEDCFNAALASIQAFQIPVHRLPIARHQTTDDYLETRRAQTISRMQHKYADTRGFGEYVR